MSDSGQVMHVAYRHSRFVKSPKVLPSILTRSRIQMCAERSSCRGNVRRGHRHRRTAPTLAAPETCGDTACRSVDRPASVLSACIVAAKTTPPRPLPIASALRRCSMSTRPINGTSLLRTVNISTSSVSPSGYFSIEFVVVVEKPAAYRRPLSVRYYEQHPPTAFYRTSGPSIISK